MVAFAASRLLLCPTDLESELASILSDVFLSCWVCKVNVVVNSAARLVTPAISTVRWAQVPSIAKFVQVGYLVDHWVASAVDVYRSAHENTFVNLCPVWWQSHREVHLLCLGFIRDPRIQAAFSRRLSVCPLLSQLGS